ncbi:hypothetical protein AAEY27_13950 [Kosakonia sp. BYX6]|uniref:EcpB C-terminal domain-containing protein n=1 Tax=Kosakonia calanthes TaxID=3139408 RepID=A0ABZ3B0Z2_9ENTR
MKKLILAFNFLLCSAMPTWALDVGDISSFIYSDSTILSKEIRNATATGRLVNIRIEKITNPLEGGKIIPMQRKDELLLSPESVLLPAESNEVIRFYYKGPDDHIERYYRIIWSDQALSEVQKNSATRHALATASAVISTILVVAPRKVKYDYKYTNGTLENTGNATLRIIAYGPCLRLADGKSCKENYYLMPGKSRTFSQVDVENKNGRVSFWQANHFVSVK